MNVLKYLRSSARSFTLFTHRQQPFLWSPLLLRSITTSHRGCQRPLSMISLKPKRSREVLRGKKEPSLRFPLSFLPSTEHLLHISHKEQNI